MSHKRLRIVLLLLKLIFVISFHGTEGKLPVWSPQDIRRLDPTSSRQLSPPPPSHFTLAATRFIIMLPFLPLIMAIPSATAFAMPLVLALQDRIRTYLPNLPTLFSLPSNTNSANSAATPGSTGADPETSRYRRSLSPTKLVADRFRDVMDLFSKTDDVVRQLSSSEPDCRRQAVCRLQYAFSPTVGSFLGNMLQVLKFERQLEKMNLPNSTRTMIKDVIKAASSGLYRQDCAAIYSKCTVKTKIT